jgi:hypothetical protein
VRVPSAASIPRPRAAYSLSQLAAKSGDEATVRDLARKLLDELLTVEALEEQVVRLLVRRTSRHGRPVKARTAKGISAIIPVLDYEAVLGELATLIEAVKRAQKHGLPLSSLQALLKAV